MKLPPGIALLSGVILGAIVAVLVLRSHQNRDPVTPAIGSIPAPLESPSDKERELWDKLAGEWASWDGQQAASFDGSILRFHAAKGWPDLEGKSFSLGPHQQTILSESGRYWVNVLYADVDAMRLLKWDLASDALSTFELFRVGTPRARARAPLTNATPPPVIQAILDHMAHMNSAAEANQDVELDPQITNPPIEVVSYDNTELGGKAPRSIVRLGESDEWMIEVWQSDGNTTLKRVIRGSAELVRKQEGGISEYLYPYYANGKLITGVSATGLHQVKVLSEDSCSR